MSYSLILSPADILVLLSGVAALCWFYRRHLLLKSKKRILQLETEMLASHTEILELEKEITRLYEATKIDGKGNYLYIADAANGA